MWSPKAIPHSLVDKSCQTALSRYLDQDLCFLIWFNRLRHIITLLQLRWFSMITRRLGQNGPEVAALGIGAMSFSNFYGPTSDQDVFDVMTRAIDLQINHIDTANLYGAGRSETLIGAFLKAQGKQAEDFFTIATKASIRKADDGQTVFDNSLAHLESALDASLKRLGLEAVDLFYAHRKDQSMEIEEVADNLATLVKKGKAKAIGFSEIAPFHLRRAHAVHPVAAIQSEYSLSVRAPELGLVQTAAEIGATMVAFSPVGRSLLTDKPYGPDDLADKDFLRINPRFMGANLVANIKATDKLRVLARDVGMPTAALAIGWLLAQAQHVLPIPGTRSAPHLAELAKALETPLSADILAKIDEILPVGWAHGDRYSHEQWRGPERYS